MEEPKANAWATAFLLGDFISAVAPVDWKKINFTYNQLSRLCRTLSLYSTHSEKQINAKNYGLVNRNLNLGKIAAEA